MMFLMTFSVSFAFIIVNAHYKNTVCTDHYVLDLEWNISLNLMSQKWDILVAYNINKIH